MTRARRILALGLVSGGVLASLSACGPGPDASLYVEDAAGLLQDARGNSDVEPDIGGSDADSEVAVRDTAGSDVVDDPDTVDGGEPDAPSTDTGMAPPCVYPSPEIDFGNPVVGAERTEPLRLEHCGDFDSENVVVSSVAFVNEGGVNSAPEFFFAGAVGVPITVIPFDRVDIDVHFRSDAPGTFTAVLRVETNDPDHAIVDIPVTATVL